MAQEVKTNPLHDGNARSRARKFYRVELRHQEEEGEAFCLSAVAEKHEQIFSRAKRFYDTVCRRNESHESVTNKVNIEIKVGRLRISWLFACFRDQRGGGGGNGTDDSQEQDERDKFPKEK